MRIPASTLEGLETGGEGRAALWFRRGFLALVVCLVLAGLLGLLGVHARTATAEEAGWSVSVRYAGIARAGLDVPWEVTVTHPGGLGSEVTLAVSADYFDIFETQGFHPEPSDETNDGSTLYLTFTAPPGDRLRVTYDAYIQPASQRGASGTVSIVDHGRPIAPVHFRTFLLP